MICYFINIWVYQVSGGVTERSRLLSQIADELESVKAEMEDRGSSMTDGSPLVNIRKTLARMKQEVTIFNIFYHFYVLFVLK